ncbi:hypothetical protein [Trinickia soli]|uniref:Uncharacterized protein n=1 Tax=Trinickia soli TaxID=380675 RepID=A0A2N7VQ32_9BURK|nr:hypothetical protein [Trinickia soli]PMS19278.1 hypothetical protein C0Z19_21850 [Trinickia soli]CAB3644263.1 hypothetical protein LMG24076_00475 [Trinickia soli]
MQPTLIPSRTDDALAFISERAQAQRDEAQDRAESRDEQKAAISKARLNAKLAALTHDDLVAGLHSVTRAQHGAELRAAWLDGEEALGAMLMRVVRDQLADEADLEAEEVLIRIEGSAREEAPRRRTFIIAGA